MELRNYLTNYDIDIKDNNIYYPLYDVLKILGIEKENIFKYRKESFYKTKKICDSLGIKKYSKYWNYNVQDFDNKINSFLNDERIFPIANVIEMYRIKKLGKILKNEYHYAVNFAIKKEYIINYAKFENVNYKRHNYFDMDKNYLLEKQKIGKKLGSEIIVAKTNLLENFKIWAKQHNLSLDEALEIMIDSFLKSNNFKIQDIVKYEVYNIRHEVDSEELKIKIDKKTQENMMDIIARYNLSNIIQISLDDYVQSAILEKNIKVPVKYRNPDLYNEKEKMEKFINYYKEKLID